MVFESRSALPKKKKTSMHDDVQIKAQQSFSL